MNTCTVDGCDKPTVAKGLCMNHYQRMRRNGTLTPIHPLHRKRTGGSTARTPAETVAHVLASTVPGVPEAGSLAEQRGLGECLLWTGHLNTNGYFSLGSEIGYRTLYEMFIGPLVTGKQIDHLCRNRACANPYHFEQVTPSENYRRGKIGQHTSDRRNTYGTFNRKI